ncbi:MAG: hypothetical protein HYY49_08935 [Ignavibacteriales bacterium]|nr:hypothetical protein [Ignavibacteriales bacterium]
MDTYSRKISAEEACENYILVYKDKLAFFPMLGKQFDLMHGGTHKRAMVESYHCECRGAESPHEHYFIRWDGLTAGDNIFLQRDPRKAWTYRLQIRSASAQREMCG